MPKVRKPFIIAHRGESYDAPENTLAAIKLAWERGADAVEVDIHLTRDHQVVVIHDFNTQRLGGRDKKVADQTLDELKQLDVGSWKDKKWRGEQVPTLKEVLQTVPPGKKLIIEIKSEKEILPSMKADLKTVSLQARQVEFIGFDLETMALVKKEFPESKALWLHNLDFYRINMIFMPSIMRIISEAKEHNLDGLNVWAGKMLNKSMIDKVHNAGLLIYCWTVDDPEKAKNLKDWGIDAITTNRAQWMNGQMGD